MSAIVSDPQPSDLVSYPGHVAIYIGGSQTVETTMSLDLAGSRWRPPTRY